LVNSVTQKSNDVVGGAHRDITFYYKDIKQEIVHTLLLEEYGVSKKWIIIMDKRQDKTAVSTQAETSGSSAWIVTLPGAQEEARRNGDE